MRVTLIHNPNAGDDTQPTVGQLVALIREAGHKVRWQSVKEKGWARVLRKRSDLIAVAGGDGTVGRVARRVVGRGVPITVLPMGTANNISKTLGMAGRPVHQLIREWEEARHLKFDAGVAKGPWGTRYFIEGVGLGLFARTLPEIRKNKTMAHLSDAEVKVTYALQMLRDKLEDLSPRTVTATLDGRDISGKYLMLEAMNTRYIGPNLLLAPDVPHSSGRLDIVFVQEKDRKKLARFLATWQQGKMWPSGLGIGRGKRLTIEWTGFPIHLDDKLWPKKGKSGFKPPATMEIGVERAALEFLVPAPHAVRHR
ncbi:MAG TPA: diacylglycerol kinase family protein [Burkholderiales bacterium]|nr:diacylglycerol kinase family protein [Burkholderiales bacterium]